MKDGYVVDEFQCENVIFIFVMIIGIKTNNRNQPNNNYCRDKKITFLKSFNNFISSNKILENKNKINN